MTLRHVPMTITRLLIIIIPLLASCTRILSVRTTYSRRNMVEEFVLGPASGIPRPIHCLRFSPDSRILYTGGADAEVIGWDPETRKARFDFTFVFGTMLNKAVTAITALPGRDRLALGSAFSGLVYITGTSGPLMAVPRQLNRIHGHSVNVLLASPDGNRVFSGSSDTTICIWKCEHNVVLNRQINHLRGHSGAVLSLALSPDGEKLHSGSSTGELFSWDIKKSRKKMGRTLPGAVTALLVPSTGRYLLCGSSDGFIRYLSPDTLATVRRINAHSGGVLSLSMASNARVLVSSGRDGSVKVWDRRTARLLHVFRNGTRVFGKATISPDGRLIAVIEDQSRIRIFRMDRGTASRKTNTFRPRLLERLITRAATAPGLAVSPGGRFLGYMEGRNRLRIQEGTDPARSIFLKTDFGRLRCLSFAGESPVLLAWGYNRGLEYDALQGRITGRFSGAVGHITACGVSVRDGFLATGNSDGRLYLWDRTKGTVRKTLTGHNHRITSIIFLPGKGMRTADTGGLVLTRDPVSGKLLTRTRFHIPDCTAIALSPGGRYVASARGINTIDIRNFRTKRLLKTLRYPGSRCRTLIFSDRDRNLWALDTRGFLWKWGGF